MPSADSHAQAGGALDRRDDRLTLTLEIVIRLFEDRHQRAWLELVGHCGNILQPLSSPERAQESRALRARALQRCPLRENDRPGKNAEDEEDEENDLSHGAGLLHQLHNLPADNKAK